MPNFVTPQQITLNYQTFGDAKNPALVFSNSLGTNLSMWQAQIEFFQKDFFVIAYDTRGHGASSTATQSFGYAELAQDVIDLLDHLNIQTAYFCGISMGGLTGQWLARYFPERFKKVVVCNTAAKIGQAQAWQERAALVRTQGLQPIAATAATRWFTEGFVQNNPDLIQKLSNDLAAGSAEGYAQCCEALAHIDLRDEIAKIQIPVLIIAGSADPVTTVADGQFMQQQIHGATLAEIAASHISNIEQPEHFNQCLKGFIV
ncbi:3-oxoadipate enol-lactonase [Acinetobacter sp. ANC 4635]|uniref:3-oxoadipate enol-lactonase n=1 Tax=Acinetobacter sp. ANC 4635 TaxID=2529846 RepID=UPI00103CE817|nr:3-oxoadipate enol-lactonase [Acinetobacter sp. ANC 4635]TCB24008.1 3-oxoadipate enol-lactonase [Acinetobacter sp. ANC 4635]